MAVWDAEHVVDESLARRLLGQFPGVRADRLRLLASGFDYTIWVAEERYAFRFPRRAVVLPGLERELAVLPELAPLLPLPVPVPLFVGRADAGYPWPFFGSQLLPGAELTAAELDDEGRVEAALGLVPFLHALHAVDLDMELPVDVNGRADMSRRVPLVREGLEQLGRPDDGKAEPILVEAELLPPAQATCVVHGDLHVRNVLGDGPRLTGVVDWVDVCRADPAIDLSLFWSFVPPAAREAVFAAYGPLDEAQLLRARVLALSLCAALAAHARAEGLALVEREALAGLGRALAP